MPQNQGEEHRLAACGHRVVGAAGRIVLYAGMVVGGRWARGSLRGGRQGGEALHLKRQSWGIRAGLITEAQVKAAHALSGASCTLPPEGEYLVEGAVFRHTLISRSCLA